MPSSSKTRRLPATWRQLATVLLFGLAAASLRAEDTGTAPPMTRESIRGIFSFLWAPHVQNKGLPPSLELDYVQGATLIMPWRDLEPEQGRYRWELIDDVLTQAQARGKIVNLGIFPGERSPDYVLNACPELFTVTQQTHGGEPVGKVMRAPLPWDETYTQAWFGFIRVLSERYGNHPAIGYLQICGPAPTAMEMSLRLPPKDYPRYRQAGYTVARYTDLWKKTIDYFATAWPHKPLAVTLGTVPPDEGTELSPETAVAVARHMEEKLGHRALVKVAFLNGKWWQKQKPGDHAKPLIDLMRSISGQVWTGGEMFWESRDKNESVNGPLRLAMQNGIDAGMKWLEVYQMDIAGFGETQPYAPYVEDLRWADRQLLETSH